MNRRWIAGSMMLAVGIAVSGTVGSAAATSDQTAVVATIRQFANGLNTGDVKSALATCATSAAIIDEFPPHEWQGPTACADWAKGFAAANKSQGITAGVVTIGKPDRVDVTAGRAYVVAPATYSYRQHGKRITESNAVFTAALEKTAAGWRITGWAWAAR